MIIFFKNYILIKFFTKNSFFLLFTYQIEKEDVDIPETPIQGNRRNL